MLVEATLPTLPVALGVNEGALNETFMFIKKVQLYSWYVQGTDTRPVNWANHIAYTPNTPACFPHSYILQRSSQNILRNISGVSM